jgi:hypothetical protein
MRSSVVLLLAAAMVAALLAAVSLTDEDDFDGGAVAADVGAPVDPPVVVLRSGDRVPADWAERASAVPGVDEAIYVRRGQAPLTRVVRTSGEEVQTVRPGYAIPVDTLVADAPSYASMLPARARDAVAQLRPGEAVLGESAALRRSVDVGDTLEFAGAKLYVGAVVDDASLVGAEMLIASPQAGVQLRAGLVLARIESPGGDRRLATEFADERGGVVWRGFPYGSERGAIVQPGELKARFGEVAVRVPFARDRVRLDPDWVQQNIVKEDVPILGRVACNRVLMPRLRKALGALERRGLASTVDRGDFAGCYVPRRIPQTGALSLHALGLAVDLNARANPYGKRSRQDRRLVAAMERQGLVWGGAWPTVKDAMHFEYQGEGP